MRKAQIETPGLVIVIILILIGMVFVSRFTVEEPIEYKKQFTQAELASNMIYTLLKTTSACKISMTELLRYCGENLENPSINCSGIVLNSCDYVEQETQEIFKETLEKWNIGYEFKVFFDEENPIFTLGRACFEDRKSKLFPIPTDSGILFVKIDICG